MRPGRGVRHLLLIGLVLALAACAGDRAGNDRRVSGYDARARYIVQPGDSVYTIARANGVTTRDIIDANRLQPPYTLQPGQELVLILPRRHEVQRGDTLYGISRHYNVNVNELARVNGLKPPYTIYPGTVLNLPRPNAATQSASVSRPGASPGGGAAASGSQVPAPAAKPGTAAAPAQASRSGPRPAPKPVSLSEPASRSGAFLWPVRGKILSSYGSKADGRHNDGINIAAPAGTPVLAAENGVVAYAGEDLVGFGRLVLIRHADDYLTAYAHNDRLLVQRGQQVRRGEQIATVGQTGNVTSPQLHFELRRHSAAIDPRRYLGDS
jgi:murein DD-endopeptidase MepM/ murein hydrolase activator NlpD